MEDSISVECSNCGFVFQNEESNEPREKWEPCPYCGSLKRMVRLTHRERLELYERQKLKAKKPSSKRKWRRPDYEEEKGKKIGGDGKLVDKTVIKDREHPDLPNSYVETVRDKDGNIIVDKHEKLSEHREG